MCITPLSVKVGPVPGTQDVHDVGSGQSKCSQLVPYVCLTRYTSKHILERTLTSQK